MEGKEFEDMGIEGKPCKVIISNGMTFFLKKGQHGAIAQLCSLYIQTSKPSIPLDLQKVIENHSKVFEDIPKGLPHTQEHGHAFHLILGSLPPTLDLTDTPMSRRVRLGT